VGNFIERERVETTEARARELRRRAEKLVTISKREGLATYRLLRARLPEKAAKKLVREIGPRYKDRAGGYTRIIKTEKRRKRDGATVVILEFIK
jgi:large subunit ribosomal protein L17